MSILILLNKSYKKSANVKYKEGKEMSGRVLLNVIIIFLIINLITVLKINHRMNEINNSLTAKEAVTLPSGLPENLEVIY